MPTNKSKRLVHDDRGAMMVMGLFGAILIVGFIYFMFGVGETLRHTERMQDAADSGAFSVAVMHAEGMNLTALFNMTLLSVVAIRAALWAIFWGTVLTAIWIASGGYYRWLRYGYMWAFLALLGADVLDKLNDIKDDVDDIIEASNDGREALREMLPPIAFKKVRDFVTKDFDPPVDKVFVWPVYKELAAEEGSTTKFCISSTNYHTFPPEIVFWHSMIIVVAAIYNDLPELKAKTVGYATGFTILYCMIEGEADYVVEDEAALGSDRFQLRMFVLGKKLPTVGESGVRFAAFGRDDNSSIKRLRDKLSRISFAQAEYYFDGTNKNMDLLWHMNWRARLRRFRMPEGESGNGIQSVCSGGSDVCSGIGDVLNIENIVVH